MGTEAAGFHPQLSEVAGSLMGMDSAILSSLCSLGGLNGTSHASCCDPNAKGECTVVQNSLNHE